MYPYLPQVGKLEFDDSLITESHNEDCFTLNLLISSLT